LKNTDNLIFWDLVSPALNKSINAMGCYKLLYHYTNLNAFENILNKSSLWLTDYRFLNDTEECANISKIMLKIRNSDKYKKFNKNLKNIIRKVSEENYFQDICNHNSIYYVCSLSSDGDNWSLWNAYTKCAMQAGFALGFNFSNLFSCNDNAIVHELIANGALYLSEIIYNDNEKESILYSILEKANQLYESSIYTREQISTQLKNSLNALSILYKNSFFEAEKEVRLILKLDDLKHEIYNNSELYKHRISGQYIIPYINLPLLKSNILSKIVFSPGTNFALRKQGVASFLNTKNYLLDIENDLIESKIPLRLF